MVSFSQWLCGKVRALEDVFGWGLQVQMMQIKRLRVKVFRSRRCLVPESHELDDENVIASDHHSCVGSPTQL
jgi:hypothetical protein